MFPIKFKINPNLLRSDLILVFNNSQLHHSAAHGTGSSPWMNQDQSALQTGLKFNGFYGTSDGG